MTEQSVNFGTVLEGVQTLLDYLGEDGVKVSKSKRQLPMKDLSTLNQQLPHPANLVEGRFKQGKYPGIQGVYMLLLCSGLARFKQKGKNTWLIPEMTDQWKSLNDAEKYASLLYYWVFHGRSEIIGERDRLLMGGEVLVSLTKYTPQSRSFCFLDADTPMCHAMRYKTIKFSDSVHFDVHYTIGSHNLALLEMFGLITIEQPKTAGKDWSFNEFTKEPQLLDIAQCLCDFYDKPGYVYLNRMMYLLDPDEIVPPGEFVQGIRELLPAVGSILAPPDREPLTGVYVLDIKVTDCSFKLQVPCNCDFWDLAASILDIVEFDQDHLYDFRFHDKHGCQRVIDYESSRGVELSDLCLEPGDSLVFRFDFGDNWLFAITVDSFNPSAEETENLALLEMKGTLPVQYPDYDGW